LYVSQVRQPKCFVQARDDQAPSVNMNGTTWLISLARSSKIETFQWDIENGNRPSVQKHNKLWPTEQAQPGQLKRLATF
jgi:hypothetical protein